MVFILTDASSAVFSFKVLLLVWLQCKPIRAVHIEDVRVIVAFLPSRAVPPFQSVLAPKCVCCLILFSLSDSHLNE